MKTRLRPLLTVLPPPLPMARVFHAKEKGFSLAETTKAPNAKSAVSGKAQFSSWKVVGGGGSVFPSPRVICGQRVVADRRSESDFLGNDPSTPDKRIIGLHFLLLGRSPRRAERKDGPRLSPRGNFLAGIPERFFSFRAENARLTMSRNTFERSHATSSFKNRDSGEKCERRSSPKVDGVPACFFFLGRAKLGSCVTCATLARKRVSGAK